jgi:hypothetical protein
LLFRENSSSAELVLVDSLPLLANLQVLLLGNVHNLDAVQQWGHACTQLLSMLLLLCSSACSCSSDECALSECLKPVVQHLNGSNLYCRVVTACPAAVPAALSPAGVSSATAAQLSAPKQLQQHQHPQLLAASLVGSRDIACVSFHHPAASATAATVAVMAGDAAADKMLALTFGGTEQIVLSTVDKPRILQPTDVIVKVTLCGICGR